MAKDTTNDYEVRREGQTIHSGVLGTAFEFPKAKALRFAAHIVDALDADDEFAEVLAAIRDARAATEAEPAAPEGEPGNVTPAEEASGA